MSQNLLTETMAENYQKLMGLVPKRGFGYARRVAEVLNANDLKPLRAEVYTTTVVHMAVHSSTFDPNIEPALIWVIEQFFGKAVEELLPGYERVFPRKSLKAPKKRKAER